MGTLFLLILLAGGGLRAPGDDLASSATVPLRGFFADSAWDDGQAEVSTYDSERIIYGKVRRFETVMIAVKESVGTVSRVKLDRPHPQDPSVDAIKLNLLQRIQTENYPYNYLVHVLVERANPLALIKESVSSHEWCGTTFQQLNHRGGAWQYWWDSYWGGESNGFRILKGRPVSEEQLFLALRDVKWREGLGDVRWPVVWGLHKNRAVGTAPLETLVVCKAPVEVTVPAGTFRAWPVVATAVERPGPDSSLTSGTREWRASFWIEAESPFRVIRFEGSEGRKLQLRDSVRRQYW